MGTCISNPTCSTIIVQPRASQSAENEPAFQCWGSEERTREWLCRVEVRNGPECWGSVGSSRVKLPEGHCTGGLGAREAVMRRPAQCSVLVAELVTRGQRDVEVERLRRGTPGTGLWE